MQQQAVVCLTCQTVISSDGWRTEHEAEIMIACGCHKAHCLCWSPGEEIRLEDAKGLLAMHSAQSRA